MKISQQPTDYILVRAHCSSDHDSCDFAIISCGGGWAEQVVKRIEAARPLDSDPNYLSSQFFAGSASFYRSGDDNVVEVLPEGQNWAFVELDEGEEEGFDEPESRLNCHMFDLDRNGRGIYKAYSKNTNYEFFTDELPLAAIVESITQHL